MRLVELSAVVACVAGLAAAEEENACLAVREIPDVMPLYIRQTSGPQFDCHSDCGFTIQGGRQPDHCSNATWTDNYNGCLECALTFDIWTIYGNGVTNAASACGLTPTPSPSGFVAGPLPTMGTIVDSTTSAPAPPPTAAPSTTPASTSAPVATTTTPAPVAPGGASGMSSSMGLLVLLSPLVAIYLGM